jgi:2-polyprenyl-3-methyl-5-hydroxy-6-metoxy-1,4-benzoquinol methylase
LSRGRKLYLDDKILPSGQVVTGEKMEFTGERYIPTLSDAQISYYHWHRYLYASGFVADKTVLDIACGEGYGSDLLAQTAKKVTGVDIDLPTIEHAEKTYKRKNLEFIQGTAGQIPIKGEGIFDVIVSFESIAHLDEPQQHAFLSEIKRLLKPGGVLLISTPDKLPYSMNRSYKNPHHRREFFTDDLLAFLKTKFVHVSMFGQQIYPASFIWEKEAGQNRNVEYKIGLSDGQFAPSAKEKPALFMIAHCCDHPSGALPDSSMIDLSGAMLQMAAKSADKIKKKSKIKDQTIWVLKTQLKELKVERNELASQLEEITGSKAWKMIVALRQIHDRFLPGKK